MKNIKNIILDNLLDFPAGLNRAEDIVISDLANDLANDNIKILCDTSTISIYGNTFMEDLTVKGLSRSDFLKLERWYWRIRDEIDKMWNIEDQTEFLHNLKK